MKAESLPAPRRDPTLCEEADRVLHNGEAIPGFVELPAHAQLQLHRQQALVERGLASREIARQSGGYVDAKDVLAMLQSRLDIARMCHSKAGSQSTRDEGGDTA
ncbi:hypothetical protein JR063_06620 [Xanthomonas sp. CFBP 8700]|nr:hypothetical protein [Xanthomonas bonasiae]